MGSESCSQSNPLETSYLLALFRKSALKKGGRGVPSILFWTLKTTSLVTTDAIAVDEARVHERWQNQAAVSPRGGFSLC